MSDWKEVFFEVPELERVPAFLGTLTDFGFYLESWSIGAPDPKINYIDIPGAQESLDISEAVSGKMTYNNRALTFNLGTVGSLSERVDRLDRMTNLLLGTRRDIYIPWHENITHYTPEYDDCHYNGRIKIQSIEHIEPEYTKVVLECDCSPYITKFDVKRRNIIAGTSPVNLLIEGQTLTKTVRPTVIVSGTGENGFSFRVIKIIGTTDYPTVYHLDSDGIYKNTGVVMQPENDYIFEFKWSELPEVTPGLFVLRYEAEKKL